MTSVADAVLDLNPDSALHFTLSDNETTPTCSLELRHPDDSSPPIAFKVKTTQPRRYLVRPNQGLIEPGKTQKVQILLVEKERNTLLQSYQRLGQSALDHSKDKFLVQSVAVVDPARATQLQDYDQLTALWSMVGNNPTSVTSAVANKKLHVKHSVADGTRTMATTSAQVTRDPIEKMSSEQLKAELGPLRKKYDELVAFSVNLTAERDMLNNSLEQARRDLDRNVKKGSLADNGRNRTGGHSEGGGLSSLLFFLVLMVTLVVGMKVQQAGLVSQIPVIGEMLEAKDEL